MVKKISIGFVLLMTTILAGYFFLSAGIKDVQDLEKTTPNLIRADNAYHQRYYDQAQQHYAQVLPLVGHDLDVLYRYAQPLLRAPQRNLSTLTQVYQQIIAQPQGLYGLTPAVVQQMLDVGMVSNLQAHLDELTPLLIKAMVVMQSNPSEAKRLLDQVSETQHDQSYHRLAAQLNSLLGDHQAVIENTDALLHRSDGGESTAQFYYLRAQAFNRLGDSSQAQQALHGHQLLNQLDQPSNPQTSIVVIEQLMDGWSSLATNATLQVRYINALQRSGQQQAAISQWQQTEWSLFASQHLVSLLRVAMRLKHHDMVASIYVHHQQLSDNPDGFLIQALFCEYFVKTDDASKSQKICAEGIKKYPDYAPLWHWWGQWLWQQKRPQQAVRALRKGLFMSPWRDQWRMQLAQVYLTQGKPQQAGGLFDAVMIDTKPHLKTFVSENGIAQYVQ